MSADALDVLVATELLVPAAGGAERFLLEALAALPGRWRARAVWVSAPAGPGMRLPARVEALPVEAPAATGAYWRDRRLRREAVARGVERALAVRRADVVVTQLHAGPGAIEAARAAGVPAVLVVPSYEALCKHAFAAASTCSPALDCASCPVALALPDAERAALLAARAGQAAALRDATALVAPSRFVAGQVASWCGREVAVVRPVSSRPPAGPGGGDAVVAAAARWSEAKGAHLLAQLAAALPGRRFVVAGGPGDAGVEAAFARLANVERRGYGSIASLAAEAAVAVVPSAWPEPFGRVAFELQASGVPTLARAVGGLPEVVPSDALVPPAATAESWAGRVAALDDGDVRRALAAAADARVEKILATRPVERLAALLAASR